MKVVKIKVWPSPDTIREWTAPVYALEPFGVLFVRTIYNDYRYIARCRQSNYAPPSILDENMRRIYKEGFFNFYGTPSIYTPDWLAPRVHKLKNFNAIVRAIKQDKPVPAGKESEKTDIELGVELELENKFHISSKPMTHIAGHELMDNVGYDGSVYYGNEFRFRHPKLKEWLLSKITDVLQKIVKEGYGNLYGTAGMHVHVSGTNATIAAMRARKSIRTINKIIEPICGRRRYIHTPTSGPRAGHYGRGMDTVRNQLSDFGTLEFRAFEATTDPHVFYWRLIVCKALFEHLADDKPLRSFFKDMKPRVKAAYKGLLLHPTNPHDYGEDVKTVLTWLK